MKNTLEGINSRLDDRKEWISDMKGRIVEITQAEKQKDERVKKKEFKGPLGYHQVCQHLHYRGLRGKKERGGRKLI